MRGRQGCSFLKKEPKNFFPLESKNVCCRRYKAKLTKVFCFFFSKKKSLSRAEPWPYDSRHRVAGENLELSAGHRFLNCYLGRFQRGQPAAHQQPRSPVLQQTPGARGTDGATAAFALLCRQKSARTSPAQAGAGAPAPTGRRAYRYGAEPAGAGEVRALGLSIALLFPRYKCCALRC